MASRLASRADSHHALAAGTGPREIRPFLRLFAPAIRDKRGLLSADVNAMMAIAEGLKSLPGSFQGGARS
jgi:hypothetical protein